MLYANYISQSLAPVALQGVNGTKWCTGIGEEKDALKQRIIDSVALRFPTYAPADSLLQHSLDRQIERAPGESDASFRKRLLKAHETWKWSGTDYGVLIGFEAIGWTITHVDAYDSLVAEWPYEPRSITTHVWLGPGTSVTGTPVDAGNQYSAGWHFYGWAGPAIVTSITVTGATLSNTDGWKLYATFDAGDVYLYKDTARTQLVASYSGGAWAGPVSLSEFGGSGLSATAIHSGLTDYDEGATLEWRVDVGAAGVRACAWHSSDAIGYVLDSGVAVGGTVRIATRSDVWIVAARDWAPPPEWTGGFDALWPVLDAHAHATAVDIVPFCSFGYFDGAYDYHVAHVGSGGILLRNPLESVWNSSLWPASCAAGDSLVIFGGWDSFTSTLLGYTFVWDWHADDWRVANPATSPSARHGACMCEDVSGRVLLFGGYDGAADGETWIFVAGEWTQLSPTFAPSARYHAAMAPIGQLVYLFGGTPDGVAASNQTWCWDGATWTPVVTSTTPAGRFGHTMTTVGGRIVMYGGRTASGTLSNEVCIFDGTDWTIGTTATTGRYWHGAAAVSDHEMLVWGGNLGGLVGSSDVFVIDTDTLAATAGTALPWTWYGGAHASLVVRRTIRKRGAGYTRDGSHVRGTALSTAERNAMLTSIRKWKAADSTYPTMYYALTSSGFRGVRSPCSARGTGLIRGGRHTKISVGEG